jgi:hypothetical protein
MLHYLLICRPKGLISPTTKMISLKKEMTHSRFGQMLSPAKYQAIPDQRLKGEHYQTHTVNIDQRVISGLRANISGFQGNPL